MSRRISEHIRSNVWAILACFLAVMGTAVVASASDDGSEATKSASVKKQIKKLKQRVAALERKPGLTIPTSLPPSGPAGGGLAGSYPTPLIAPNAVGSSELADNVSSLNVGTGTFPSGIFTGAEVDESGIIIREDSNIVTQIRADMPQDIFGHAVVVNGRLFPDFIALGEISDPGTPPANLGYMYLRQSAGGFTELVIEWNDSTDVIAIESVAG